MSVPLYPPLNPFRTLPQIVVTGDQHDAIVDRRSTEISVDAAQRERSVALLDQSASAADVAREHSVGGVTGGQCVVQRQPTSTFK